MKNNTPTPHNSAAYGDFAKVVLMPGDPIRAKFIADNFLENARLVNNVRGVQGYTGTYKGKEVSVMASGMGNPTIGIYSYELFAFYGVEAIIRVGSIGSFREDVELRDIIISEATYTNTNYGNFFIEHGRGYVDATKDLVDLAVANANKLGRKYHVGGTLCSDTFYAVEDELGIARENGLYGVEMECAALYLNAQRLNKKAVAICTVSDNIVTGAKASSDERAQGYNHMIELALEVALNV
ncbi:MAG: purine-nucleoside phosphorylase [Clostridia bacterium]|nr:purine-nucleoside phosphorylase [Clostridia bacterium]